MSWQCFIFYRTEPICDESSMLPNVKINSTADIQALKFPFDKICVMWPQCDHMIIWPKCQWSYHKTLMWSFIWSYDPTMWMMFEEWNICWVLTYGSLPAIWFQVCVCAVILLLDFTDKVCQVFTISCFEMYYNWICSCENVISDLPACTQTCVRP